MSFDELDQLIAEELGEPSKPETARPTVLVVDDDNDLLEALAVFLGDRYQLILCHNGDEAIGAMARELHAVLLDIKMQGKDGFETFTELKRRQPLLPVIFHSAYQDSKDPYEIMNNYRPFGYIHKGRSTSMLLDTLASAVEYTRQIQLNGTLVTELRQANQRLEHKVEERTAALSSALSEVKRLASVDDLTGLWNRRVFFERLAEERSRAERYGRSLSLALMDIDLFKRVNDTFGHPQGDRVLQGVAQVLQADRRLSDLTGRLGGEEFGVILPETDGPRALVYAERIRAAVEGHPFQVARGGREELYALTLSVGLCTNAGKPLPSVEALVSAADKALYEAKAAGRNRVIQCPA